MENDIMRKLAKRIKRYRKLKELTQEELAYRAEITTQHLGTIERGTRKNVTLLTIQKIADALEVPLCELICEEEKAQLEEEKLSPQTKFLISKVANASLKKQRFLLKVLAAIDDWFDNE